MARRRLIAGNWKMNGSSTTLDAFENVFAAAERLAAQCDMAVFPPATLIAPLAQAARDRLTVGAQDVHAEPSGARTGWIAAEMARDAGARRILAGHSERRAAPLGGGAGEADADVRAKAEAARRAGLAPLICLGESDAERSAGSALDVVLRQFEASAPDTPPPGLDLAYEPIWAIGTGRVPSLEDIAEIHSALHGALSRRYGANHGVRVLYGGSVKPSNAAEIFSLNVVDGALVGGASLDPAAFIAIAEAA